VVAAWVGARSSEDVLAAFDAAQAAIGPVYSMRDLLADPHVRERGVFVDVDGVVMQGPVARLSRTPGEVRYSGRALGADTEEVLRGVATPGAAPPSRRGESEPG
jgi:crotonobetainyl-CoA:carnitine CoA-transferase CaiB-like acyl-CoA transferase